MKTSLDFFSNPSTLLSIVTFAFGLIIGNRLAIGRDKRKEFNEIASPIRSSLLLFKDRIINGEDSYYEMPKTEIITLCDMSSKYKAEKIISAYRLFTREMSYEGSYYRLENGEILRGDPSNVLKSIDSMLNVIKLK